MGRLSLSDLDKIGGGSSGGFFSLKDDGDEAQVRILLNKLEDMEDGFMYACHSVPVEGSKYGRDVACLRNYGDPVDKCPLCANGYKVNAKLFIPLYNVDTDEVQLWNRGKGFMSKFSTFCSRYSKPSIVSHLVTIHRTGEAGSMQTTYELFMDEVDDVTLEDLPEAPQPLGMTVIDASADDMNYYLEEGEFPPNDSEQEQEPVRRRGRQQEEEEEEAPRNNRKPAGGATRRTPAGRGRRDTF